MALKWIIIAAILVSDLIAGGILMLRATTQSNPLPMFAAAGITVLSGIIASVVVWFAL